MCKRKLKIKKLIPAAVLCALFLTCTFFMPEDDFYDEGGGKVFNDYSLTVYLDGSAPPDSSRSLNKEQAMFGHDLFEVAFVRPYAGGEIVARAAWERGHPAGISGVARGFDYGYVDVASATTNNAGAAIIFVGKRSDKTLLGVGRLTGVNNGSGFISSTVITNDTISVEFTVSALKAGAIRESNPNKSESSFITGGAGGYTTPDLIRTRIIDVYMGSRMFPLYRMDQGQTTYADYKIDVTTGNFDSFYRAGVLRGGSAALILNDPEIPTYGPEGYRLLPRYPRGDGTYGTPPSTLPADNKTVITLLTNIGAGTALANPTRFSFNTSTTANKAVFSFAFEIPVFPLTNSDSRGNQNFWYIRPGYDSYLRDIDDGIGGTGGAVLIGIGEIDQSLIFDFFVGTPFKTRYYRSTYVTDPDPVTPSTPENPPAPDDYKFDLTGLELAVRAGGVPMQSISVYSARYFLQGPPDLEVFPDQNLFPIFFQADAGGNPIYDSTTGKIQRNPAYAHLVTNDMIMVRVEYFDPITQTPPDFYYGFFSIYLSDPLSGGQIPPLEGIAPQNRYVIANWLDMIRFNNEISTATSGDYILVFYNSMDFPSISLNGGPYLFIILAANPDIVIGKQIPPDASGGFINYGNRNTFYYGIWPYNDQELIIFGTAITSYPFRLNAAGRYANIDSGTPETTGEYFMSSPTAGTTIIVNTGSVDVVYPNSFVQP